MARRSATRRSNLYLCGLSPMLCASYSGARDEDVLYMQDIRVQFAEQLRCLEQRTDTQVALLAELQDFFRRKAEVEAEHSRSLDKLAKHLSARHKTERAKRESWPQHGAFGVWQQLLDDTKRQARQSAVVADLCTHHFAVKLASQSEDLQRIARKCREIGSAAHQEISRVLSELHTAMKSYQLSHGESGVVEGKFRVTEQQKCKFESAHPGKLANSRRYRALERDFEKRQAKYQEFKLKALKARNEYILCVDAANAALHKYFADDLSDLIDCMDLGLQHSLRNLMTTMVSARKCLCQSEMVAVAGLDELREQLDSRADKQRFLEANHGAFMLPRRFEFRPQAGDELRQLSGQKCVQEELIQRLCQIERRLVDLKAESEEIWKTLSTAEERVLSLQSRPLVPVEELCSLGGGAAAKSAAAAQQQQPDVCRRSCRESEADIQKRKLDLAEVEDYYLDKFEHYVIHSNLIKRLQARHDALRKALGVRTCEISSLVQNGHSPINSPVGQQPPPLLARFARRESAESSEPTTPSGSSVDVDWLLGGSVGAMAPAPPPKPKKRRIGAPLADNARRPRLFGGSLEEYVEATNEELPLVLRSTIRWLSTFALHHQGLFRVSGSQLEINTHRDAFERGEDPLSQCEAGEVNSVAGVLKLYFRELREPLFPIYMFDQFTECAKLSNRVEFVAEVRQLICTLPPAVVIVLRYLFGFLNHLTEYSDENMMDPYNLAICFGPTLLPIPEGKDQVFYHNHVNELVKNLINYYDDVFPFDWAGPVYEKFQLTDADDVLADERERLDSMVDSVIGSISTTVDEPTYSDTADDDTSPSTVRRRDPPVAVAAAAAHTGAGGPVWMKRQSMQQALELPSPTDPDHLSCDCSVDAAVATRPTHRAETEPPPSTGGGGGSTTALDLSAPADVEEGEQAAALASPTSLHEIQYELKAVLNSLEQFSLSHRRRSSALASDDGEPVDKPDLVQNLPAGSPVAPQPPPLVAPQPPELAPRRPAAAAATAKQQAPPPPRKPLLPLSLPPPVGPESPDENKPVLRQHVHKF